MYPLHDDNLDHLSREAAEHFEVEPRASGWAHLENRLDKELPQKKKRRRFLFWLFFITATTGGALAGIMKYKPVTPLANNVPGVVSPAEKIAPLPNNYAADSNTAGTVKNNRTAGSYSTPVASLREPGVERSPLTLNYGTITPGNPGKDTRHLIKPAKRKPGQAQRTNAGKNNQSFNPVQDNNTVSDIRVTDNDQNTNGEPAAPIKNPVTAQPANGTLVDPIKDNKAVVSPVADSAKTPAGETVKKEKAQKKDKTKQPLELGLVAGPDMSTVAFGPLYKTGYNFGLQIGFRFSNRWSVNTGVIYTKRFYKADGQYFHYKTPWELDKVEGNCSMWEIPLNVRYDVSFNDKRRWFISTGLSTYLMDKENYMMHYMSIANPYPMNSDSNSSYLFSIWNLSAGMERSLGKHFSIQAEPYLKVPLKGLGKGSMRMDSYGILFTLKYKPTFNAKKAFFSLRIKPKLLPVIPVPIVIDE